VSESEQNASELVSFCSQIPQANQPTALLSHEVDGLQRDLLSSDGQITFSRFSSSTTITICPARMAVIASSIRENADVR
jgi:hypothetical protein